MSSLQQAFLGTSMSSGTTYATWNPSDNSTNVTLSGGNLIQTITPASNSATRSTISKTTGKWYWEVTINTAGNAVVGIANNTEVLDAFYPTPGAGPEGAGYRQAGNVYNSATSVATAASYTSGDIIGVALDTSISTVYFYKNNTLVATYAYSFTGGIYAMNGGKSGSNMTTNFGASAFVYSPPSGFNAGLYN